MLSQSCNTKYAFFLILYVFGPQDVGLEEDASHTGYCLYLIRQAAGRLKRSRLSHSPSSSVFDEAGCR